MGVPQEGIQSIKLFNLKINNIRICLNPGFDRSLYVDDFLIYYRSNNTHTLECYLQQYLIKIN